MFVANLFFQYRFNQLFCRLLLVASAARVPYFFVKISNESKNNQPRIVIVGTDFTTYDFRILQFCYLFIILIYIEKE